MPGTVDERRTRAGRALMVGFAGTRLDAATRRALADLRPGGVILFGRNLASPEEYAGLWEEISGFLPASALVALDQEGGRVSRLEPWVGPTPTAETLARAPGGCVARFAEATASALRALGFNLDFAPVVDLCAPDVPNGIGDRSYGTDPPAVSRLAGSFLDGLQRGGVAGCLKHFPGLGHTTVDSHRTLPTDPRDVRCIEEQDLFPYRALGGRAATVMVGHGHYPALGTLPILPATLSREIVTGWLRERLGFAGLVVSDDMEMGAVAPLDEDGRAAVAALAAGCDLVLYCSDLDRATQARDALVNAAAADPGLDARLEEAGARIERTAKRWPASRPDLAAWAEARMKLIEAVRAV